MSKAIELEDSEVAVELVQFAYFKKVCAAGGCLLKSRAMMCLQGEVMWRKLMSEACFVLQVLEKEKKRSRKERDSGSEGEEEESATEPSQKSARKR